VGAFHDSAADPDPEPEPEPEDACVTLTVNAGNQDIPPLASLTLIAIPAKLPAAVGVPVNVPVLMLNAAQAGLLLIEYASVRRTASVAVTVGVNE
jgi:hypothetical protein